MTTAKKFNYSTIKKRRNNIAAFLTSNYLNQPITADNLYAITNELLNMLPSTVVATAVFDSVRVLSGTTIDRRFAQEFAWRLAGNVDRLVDGHPVSPWTRQLEDEVVPVRVERVVPTRRRQDFGFLFYCRVLAGTSCPMQLNQFFSARSCKILSRVVGFSNTPWGAHQYGGVGQHFTNLMFFAHILAERSYDRPAFQNISISSSMLKANKALLDVRCRTKPCPTGFEHPCANCHIGYNECSYAVHPATFVEQHCRSCNTLSFFDSDDPGIMCVNCRHKNNCSVS